MNRTRPERTRFLTEVAITSLCYILASLVTFKVVAPIQDLFFPQFPSRASLLFLPHGVRVLAEWLLGWRAVPALAPGVFIVFAFLVGPTALEPSRLAAMAIAVTSAPLVFWVMSRLGWDASPHPDRMPCLACVMTAGVVSSIMIALLTNLVLGTGLEDFVAYFIGDFFGLLFLMMILMFVFRMMRRRGI